MNGRHFRRRARPCGADPAYHGRRVSQEGTEGDRVFGGERGQRPAALHKCPENQPLGSLRYARWVAVDSHYQNIPERRILAQRVDRAFFFLNQTTRHYIFVIAASAACRDLLPTVGPEMQGLHPAGSRKRRQHQSIIKESSCLFTRVASFMMRRRQKGS